MDRITVSLWNSLSIPSCTLLSYGESKSPDGISHLSRKLCVITWNARGLKSGEPYLNHLSQMISDVIVMTEHQLWPYEVQKLSRDFTAEVVTDKRLDEYSTPKQGYGGVGLLW